MVICSTFIRDCPGARTLTSVLTAMLFCAFICTTGQPHKKPDLLWKFHMKGIVVSSPLYHDGHIYIGSYDSTFYSLNAATGKLNWRFKTNGPIGSTAVASGQNVYFFCGDGKLYCLDITSGKQRWSFRTFAGALPERRYDWPDYYQSSPTIGDDFVYFGASDGRVYALRTETGVLEWTFQTGDVVHTKPAVEGDKLVAASFDGTLYCLNRASGALIWRFKTTGHRYFPKGEINGDPVIHKGKVFVGARDYNLYAIDLHAGYCHWLKTFPRGWALPVTPHDSVIYAGTSDDRLLMALDEESGAIRWTTNLGFNIFARMARQNNTGYTGTLNGKLFSVDLTSGEIRWIFVTDGYHAFKQKYLRDDDSYVPHIGRILPNGNAILKMYEELGAIFSQPALGEGKIYVASNDGTIYCLQ